MVPTNRGSLNPIEGIPQARAGDEDSAAPHRRAPWWMFLVAASFLAYFLLLVYSDFWGPQLTGMLTDFSGGRKMVRAVSPNSPAARAGLQPGDQVVAADGRAIRSLPDWTVVRVNLEVGRPSLLEVERGGERRTLELMLKRSSWDDWTSREGIVLLAVRLAQLITLILAFVIAFSRPYVLVARVGAWFLATVATMSFLLPFGMAATWRGLPTLVGGLLWIPLLSTLAFAPLLFTFFAIFPRRLFRANWIWLFVWAPALVSFPFAARQSYRMVYRPESAVGVPDWISALSTASVPVYIVAGLIALLMNYRRLEEINQRRRVRLLVAGSVVGWLGALALFSYWWGPLSKLATALFFSPAFILPIILFLVFPLSFAYAVAKHRVLEIPVLLKRSARYLLVQRGFVVLIILMSLAAALVFIKLYTNLIQPSLEMAVPAGIGVGMGFGILLAWAGSQAEKRITERIDRLFFRSAYDARQILEDLAEKARTATSREGLAELLANYIHEALHPRTLAVYMGRADERLDLVRGDSPPGSESIPATLPLLGDLARRGQPWDVPPQEEAARASPILASLDADCLVPILERSGRLSGLLVLGPRLSEEPYSGEDKRLLASAASQVGIALESIRLADEIAERMEAERRAAREMEIAKQVQGKLFPQRMPRLERLEYTGGCIQARAVGGDYYDFLNLGAGRIALVLADISGKGISAALLMSNLQANLRSHSALALEDPRSLLCEVNRLFYESTAPEHYATLFFSTYDDDARRLRYVNCGHNPPLLLRAAGPVERVEPTATVLGLFPNWDCAVGEVELGAGDILAVFSDGVTEASSESGEEFGEDRLIEALEAHRHESIPSLHSAIITAVQQFSGREQGDDITLVVARAR